MCDKIVVCIATYNEQGTIYSLVRELVLAGYDVIVSDGGSTDKTAHCARVAGATVLESPFGIRPAMMEAFMLARNLDRYDRYVQMDAGGSHSPADLPRLLAADADVVIGSRFVDGAEYHGRRWRSWASRIASGACSQVVEPDIADWTSGYRAYSRQAVIHIIRQTYSSEMHGWQIETMLRFAADDGCKIAEVPITYYAGRSSFNAKIALEAFREWWPYFRRGYK